MCSDSYSKQVLGPGRSALEQVCTSVGGTVVGACPSDGKVGACLLKPHDNVDYGVSTVEWAYEPTSEDDVRLDCAQRGYDFVSPDGTVEPAGDDDAGDIAPAADDGANDAGRSNARDAGNPDAAGADASVRDPGYDGGADASAKDTPSSSAIPIAVSVGGTSTALLYDNGEVRLFGDYQNNRACNALDPQASVIVAGTSDMHVLRGALAIDNGDGNLCIVHADKTIHCCGANGSGQKGDGGGAGGSTDTPVTTRAGVVLKGASAVSMGYSHGCGLLEGGAAWCWGDTLDGETGAGSLGASHSPTQVVGIGGQGTLSGVRHVSAGTFHSCAALNDGKAVCWGSNNSGQLGAGRISTNDEPAPLVVQVENGDPLDDVVAVEAGFMFSCALDGQDAVWCWGSNTHGELGVDHAGARAYADRVLDSDGQILRAKALSLGVYHACVVREGGRISCWGYNKWGQVGDGTNVDAHRATEVAGLSGALAVSAGGITTGEHTCALWMDGALKCWGAHDKGQFNTSLPGTYSTTPVAIQGL